MPTTIVIGAGVGGLVTARGLAAAGHEVTVVEAADRFGGQIHTVEFCGMPVDTGAEAMFLGSPELRGLVTELGLLDQVVGPQPGTSWLHRKKDLTPLPEGVGPSGPTRLAPVAASGLLGPAALARAGLEPARAKPIAGDISVGDFITARFGRAVTDTFVDPVLGNLHAGDVYRLSLHATMPQLRAKAEEGTSILRSAGPSDPARADGSPLFATFPSGMQHLVGALLADLEARGVGVHADSRVTHLTRDGQRWVVHATSGFQGADTVVLTAGAATADLLRPHAPDAAQTLERTEMASVATLLLAYPTEAVGPALTDANGVLLNSHSGRFIKAATFLSRKWAHLADPDVFVVRTSVGRAGSDLLELMEDADIERRAHRELAEVLDIRARPVATRLTRWPHSYPQLTVGHLDRMTRVRAALAGTGLFVGAAAVDGLGLPSVVRSARALVRDVVGA